MLNKYNIIYQLNMKFMRHFNKSLIVALTMLLILPALAVPMARAADDSLAGDAGSDANLADLVIKTVRIVPEPITKGVPYTGEIQVNVANIGKGDGIVNSNAISQGISVYVYSSVGSIEGVAYIRPSALKAGQDAVASIPITNKTFNSAFPLTVMVDSYYPGYSETSRMVESNETNNTLIQNVYPILSGIQTDLIVKSINILPGPIVKGQPFKGQLQVTVTNIGKSNAVLQGNEATGISVYAYSSVGGIDELAYIDPDRLKAGFDAVFSFPISGKIFNVAFPVSALVDSYYPGKSANNFVDESNENNNTLVQNFYPIESVLEPVPDLTIENTKFTTPTEAKDLNQQVKYERSVVKQVKGRMLLRVEKGGEIWYVNPKDEKKYSVTFANALPLFENLALGITDADLAKIPIAGTNEVGNWALRNRLKGWLLLQVEQRGAIWYVDKDGYRHSVTWGNLMDLFRKLALGITNNDLNKIYYGGMENKVK